MSEPAPRFENLDWLFALQRFGMREGLEEMTELLKRLGQPQSNFDVVLVGGTNGKGSVARLLAACLEEAGARTGLFTSPHLQRVGERAMVNSVATPDADLDRLVAAVRPEGEAIGATFFEVITAACLLRFAEVQADVVVLEVGMGGRLDATNAVTPDLSVITGVALDHMKVLGNTVEEIAADKAGILRRGVPTVTGAEGAALDVVMQRAAQLGARMVVLGADDSAGDISVEGVTSTWEGVTFTLDWNVPAVRNLPEILRQPGQLHLSSPLVGQHQARNVAQAAMAALLLGVPSQSVQRAVENTRWPARLERRTLNGRFVVLDGAHNQQAAAALAASVRQLEGRVKVLVLGMSDDKDAGAVLAELRGCADHVVFTKAANSPRATDPDVLLQQWRALAGTSAGDTAHAAGAAGANGEPGAKDEAQAHEATESEVAQNPQEALQRALQIAGEGQTVVVAGSLFLVAEVRNLLDGQDDEPYERLQ